jgi:hypothetical protein
MPPLSAPRQLPSTEGHRSILELAIHCPLDGLNPAAFLEPGSEASVRPSLYRSIYRVHKTLCTAVLHILNFRKRPTTNNGWCLLVEVKQVPRDQRPRRNRSRLGRGFLAIAGLTVDTFSADFRAIGSLSLLVQYPQPAAVLLGMPPRRCCVRCLQAISKPVTIGVSRRRTLNYSARAAIPSKTTPWSRSDNDPGTI